jgi:hypothetical protein
MAKTQKMTSTRISRLSFPPQWKLALEHFQSNIRAITLHGMYAMVTGARPDLLFPFALREAVYLLAKQHSRPVLPKNHKHPMKRTNARPAVAYSKARKKFCVRADAPDVKPNLSALSLVMITASRALVLQCLLRVFLGRNVGRESSLDRLLELRVDIRL